MKQIFRLVHTLARRNAAQACAEAPDGYVVTIQEPTRTLEQNALLWPLLQDVARQVDWYGEKLTDEDWKDMFTAALKGHQRTTRGIDGRFVVFGQRTSKMGKKEFSDLIELIYAFGAEKGVIWSEPEACAVALTKEAQAMGMYE